MEDTKQTALVRGLEVWSSGESWARDEQNGGLGGRQEGSWSPKTGSRNEAAVQAECEAGPGAHWGLCRVPCADSANPSASVYM